MPGRAIPSVAGHVEDHGAPRASDPAAIRLLVLWRRCRPGVPGWWLWPAYGPANRRMIRGDLAADRAYEHNPAVSRADERQHRLGHRDLPEHVHLQLLAPGLQRQVLQRAAPADPGVVDNAVKASAATGDLSGGRVNPRLIGHVQEHRRHPVRAALPQPVRVLLAAHAGVHTVAEPAQAQRARLAATGRRTSYQHRFHHHSMTAAEPRSN